jgi:Tol biopolymer transport system component
MRTSAIVIFLILTACTGSTDNSSQEETKPERSFTDYLLYISDRGNGFDIFAFNPLEGEKQLTTNPGWDWYPQALNDGSFVHYTVDTLRRFNIKRINLDGEEMPFSTYGKTDFSVSPDGENLIYYATADEEKYMGIMKLSNPSDSAAITPKGVYSGRAVWSPDGSKVAYISDRTGSNQLFLYDVVLNKSIQLTDSAGRKKYISWSPDNERIAFTIQSGEGPEDIYIFGLEYGTTDQLTKTPFAETEIAWSPDGESIAYHAKIDNADHIYTLNVTSGETNKVTEAKGYHGEPKWIRIYSR